MSSLRSRKPKRYGDVKSRYPKIAAAMERLLYFWVDKSHKRATNPTGIRANWNSTAVYAVIQQSSGTTQRLVAARGRLAKQGLTVPRLELISAHMTTNLEINLKNALNDLPIGLSCSFTRSPRYSELKHVSIEKDLEAQAKREHVKRFFSTGRDFIANTRQKSVFHMFDNHY